jgi:hypothetical protein
MRAFVDHRLQQTTTVVASFKKVMVGPVDCATDTAAIASRAGQAPAF